MGKVATRLHKFSLLLIVVFLGLSGPLNALPIITQVAEIRRLNVTEARRGFPVRLRGVVTYFDTIGPDMFFQDESAGIWIHWTEGLPKPQKGQLIELEGSTTQVDFAPDIAQPHWRVIGESPLPKPYHPSYEELASAAQDSEWVEVEAIVRAVSADPNNGYLRLKLSVDGGRTLALLPPGGYDHVPTELVEARIRFRRDDLGGGPLVVGVDDLAVLDHPGELAAALPTSPCWSPRRVSRLRLPYGPSRVCKDSATKALPRTACT